ncbi:AAA family ATPase [Candidatus Marithrix sp. Canyon 246]|uniref:AAA family ATPase n=1 Tax=Candidatus Marithrix sp. Canyon 246 TaxID=1827136 RepID=UPI000849F6E0|nr:ATP-binding protein [Candidatus Marithrix sp. Canyon 246]
MNNTKVKKIKITNFKGIKDLKLDFTYQNTDKILDNIVIYGINGTGKSTILEAIYICLTVAHNNNLKQIEKLSLDNEWIYNNEQKFIIDIQILNNEKLIDATLEYHKNHGLKWTSKNNISLYENSFTYLSSYRVLNPSTVQSAGDWNKIYQINRKFENNYHTVKQYLVNLITDKKVETLTSKNRQVLEKIKQSFKIFFPQKVFLEQLSRTEDTKDYRLMIKNEDRSIVDLDQLSSGEREVIAFFTYLCTKATNNSILIIDEPELHLHSKWQSIILYAIHQLFPNSQLFLATHSKEIHQSSSESELFELEKGE